MSRSDLQLESGSLSTVLRWEKIADVLCLLREGRQLRNAIRSAPRTRIWSYVDLSPDARAIEQFGMGIEYAGATYRLIAAAEEGSELQLTGRLRGAAFATCGSAQLGADGCPVVVEWSRRVFTPMLEALGPKYAATCDCFMRTLQVHAASASRLCTSYTPPASPTPSLLSGLRPIAVRAARYRLSLCQHRACRCGGATARCA